MDVLDLEVAQPAFLLRHEIRQRKRRDRAGEGHLDLAGIRGGCVEDDERRGDAKADAKTDAKTSTECAQSNVRHDNSPPGRKRHRRRKMSLSPTSCKLFLGRPTRRFALKIPDPRLRHDWSFSQLPAIVTCNSPARRHSVRRVQGVFSR